MFNINYTGKFENKKRKRIKFKHISNIKIFKEDILTKICKFFNVAFKVPKPVPKIKTASQTKFELEDKFET